MIPLYHSFLLIVGMTFFVFLRNGDISHKFVGFTNLCVMEVFRETIKKNVDDIPKVIKGQSRITVRYWIHHILIYLCLPLWERVLKIYIKYAYCCVLSSKIVSPQWWVGYARGNSLIGSGSILKSRWCDAWYGNDKKTSVRIGREIRSKLLTWLVIHCQKTYTFSCTLELLTRPGIDSYSKMARCHFHPHPRFMSYDYALEKELSHPLKQHAWFNLHNFPTLGFKPVQSEYLAHYVKCGEDVLFAAINHFHSERLRRR